MSLPDDRFVPPLANPPLEPVPMDGCDVCRALVRDREQAHKTGRLDVVRSCNAELQNHPHPYWEVR
ncbi:hypothetical protein [Streptomyces sp. NPDC003077]|uniref:hypothetical protein n=1 Tax=Streptomyces sp. NPDC003077 TaxID=3154443 RepID=UPI0033B4E70D